MWVRYLSFSTPGCGKKFIWRSYSWCEDVSGLGSPVADVRYISGQSFSTASTLIMMVCRTLQITQESSWESSLPFPPGSPRSLYTKGLNLHAMHECSFQCSRLEHVLSIPQQLMCRLRHYLKGPDGAVTSGQQTFWRPWEMLLLWDWSQSQDKLPCDGTS